MLDNGEELQFEPPLFNLHITGGVTLLVGSNRLAALLPVAGGLRFFSLQHEDALNQFPHNHKELRILGNYVFQSAVEMQEPVPAHFAIGPLGPKGYCPAERQEFQWSGIATALHQSGRGADALMTSRLVSEIRASCARLERLSTAYRIVLAAVSANIKREPSATRFTSDKYAAHIGTEYKALLNALYGFRDAVLAVTHRLRFGIQDPFEFRKLKSLVVAEPSGAAKLIADSMFSQSGDLLINHMSLYRGVAQHCLGRTNPVLGDVYQLRASDGDYGELRYIVYPLYDAIEKMREIEKGASKGVLEEPSQDEIERFLALDRHRDALEFCFDCFHRLLQISDLLYSEVGIAPQRTSITDDDILELELTDASGKLIRAKRDELTGRLVEY